MESARRVPRAGSTIATTGTSLGTKKENAGFELLRTAGYVDALAQ